ncbi:hypothetical protein BCF59_0074 [Mycoplasmopsis mustelae]|uniref:Uncharacterized protein n=1 Tax=Mycoplasmopsis mustelae TaxID=171289 RepID=A0A4R7UCJ5_9BACT|nr:hypothetical protein [Mycoplasmopsis mustelae]TDV24127.1 hypothetical protein BCF59_0074 [Mycoplasmopsis mustelae]
MNEKVQKHFESLKPFKPYESVTFDRLENNFGVHPIIIFLDVYKDIYYYVKARSAINKYHHKRAKLEHEIKVPKARKGLFIHDSFVDTSEIYKISYEDLHQVFDEESIYYLETDFFTLQEINDLYTNIIRNLESKHPSVSLCHVFIDKNKNVCAKTLYACENFLKHDFEWVRQDATLTKKAREAKKTLLLDIQKNRNKNTKTLKELSDLAIWCKKEYKEALLEYHGRMNEQQKLTESFPEFCESCDLGSYCQGQLHEIRKGLETGLDISLYNNGLFDAWQMEEIRLGLQTGIDVSLYADPKLSWEQMRNKRQELSGDNFDHKTSYPEVK